MKGRGIRPIEALATLYIKEGAKFYPVLIKFRVKGQIIQDKSIFSYFPDDILHKI